MRISTKMYRVVLALMVLVVTGYGQEHATSPAISDKNHAEFQPLLEKIQSAQADLPSKASPGTGAATTEILRLEALVAEVRRSNPEIQAARKKFEARRTRPSQESTLPEPTIGFMSTNMSNPVPLTTIGKDPQSTVRRGGVGP